MENRMEQLREECLQCQKCPLAATRHHVVFGTGKTGAEVVFVGEGPGENEDLQGEPFVGRGGALLDKYLEAVDLSRERNIYIANIVKCRPPHNRDPLETEQDACIGYLRNQDAADTTRKVKTCSQQNRTHRRSKYPVRFLWPLHRNRQRAGKAQISPLSPGCQCRWNRRPCA